MIEENVFPPFLLLPHEGMSLEGFSLIPTLIWSVCPSARDRQPFTPSLSLVG